MNRLTDNDKNFGPFTLARWRRSFASYIRSGDDEDPENVLMLIAFGWALRVHIPTILKPFGKYGEHCREYVFNLSDMGNGYDFW